MKKSAIITLLFSIPFFGYSQSELYTQKIESCHTSDVSDCIVEYAQGFLGTPYVAKTLEGNEEEQLVVNFKELDCTTFVETVLAMALSSRTEATRSYTSYKDILQHLRYRNGKINGYSSRIHYFSDWLFENIQRNILQNITPTLPNAAEYLKPIHFMSTHPAAYRQLANDNEEVNKIQQIENEMNRRAQTYLPKDKIRQAEEYLQDGDIIAITTSIAGLDVAHEGFVYKKNGRVHLLHASSDLKRVVISEEPLVDYIQKHKGQTGIMVARVVE